jgi:hypothetical protein
VRRGSGEWTFEVSVSGPTHSSGESVRKWRLTKLKVDEYLGFMTPGPGRLGVRLCGVLWVEPGDLQQVRTSSMQAFCPDAFSISVTAVTVLRDLIIRKSSPQIRRDAEKSLMFFSLLSCFLCVSVPLW